MSNEPGKVIVPLGLAQHLRGLLVPRKPAPWVDALLTTTLALACDASQYTDHTLVDQAVNAQDDADQQSDDADASTPPPDENRIVSIYGAARIGTVVEAHPGVVVAKTGIGGTRVVDLPLAEQLPRIC